MRILFITENLPYPLDSGGRIRSFHILKGIAQKHEVTLVTSGRNDRASHNTSILQSICSQVRVAEKGNPRITQDVLMLAKSAFDAKPFLISRHYCKKMAGIIRKEVRTGSFDAVHYDHLDSAVYSSFVQGIPISVLDEHNIVSNQIETTAKSHANYFLRLLLRGDWLRAKRYESLVCAQMSQCLVCSDVDRDSLLQMSPAARIKTIPNGVDLSYFKPKLDLAAGDISSESISMIFIGSLDYAPCDMAVQFFIRNILPKVRERLPSASFYVIGANPSASVRKLSENIQGITLTGRVPDTRPYLARAQVCVVPIKSGSGTRLKILEAMAAGVPVVSTAIGAEGLHVQDEENILIADSPEIFSAAVIRLINEKELAAQISGKALKLVRDRYNWDSIAQKLLRVYDSLRAGKESRL